MYQTLLRDERFFDFLFQCDQDLAREIRERRCPWCGGPLHQAHYGRKPRGGAIAIGSRQALRLSLCCGREGCRRRVTPPSLRFLGRRVYLGAAVILVSAMRSGGNSRAVRELQRAVGVSRRTWRRWRRWWRLWFPRSRFWRVARGRLRAPVREQKLPRALLGLFAGPLRHRLLALLRWLLPLSTASPRRALCEGPLLATVGTQKMPAVQPRGRP